MTTYVSEADLIKNGHYVNEMIADEEWEPGEPLYADGEGNYARLMIQLLPAAAPGWHADEYWCHECDVMWALTLTSVCWVCGGEARHPQNNEEIDLRRERHLAFVRGVTS